MRYIPIRVVHYMKGLCNLYKKTSIAIAFNFWWSCCTAFRQRSSVRRSRQYSDGCALQGALESTAILRDPDFQ